jgi:RNA polymerase sigma-70 factor (ECF subfamily)
MGEQADLGDAELVFRARAGDAEAYGRLVFRYQRAADSLALGVTRRHEDAQDAAQEAFVVALERLDECRNPEKFGGWFLTIVRNRARNLVRRETLRAGDVLPPSLASARPGPDRDTERGELRDKLTAALGALTEVQREVVLLHDLEGWKHREIAEVLDMPPGTVRSHLHYARKKLREALGGSPESKPDVKEDE